MKGLKLFCVIALLLLIPTFILLSNRDLYTAGDEPSYLYQGLRMAGHPELKNTVGRAYLIDRIAGLQFFFRDVPVTQQHLDMVNEKGIVAGALIFWDIFPNVLFWGRLPFVLMSVILGLFIFKWAKELYGENAGLLALFLYVFEPNIIAYSSFISSDFNFMFFSFFTAYSFYRFIQKRTVFNAMVTGFFLGLLCLTKLAALFMFPILLAMWVFMRKGRLMTKKALISAIAMLLVCWLVICVSYNFSGVFTPIGKSIAADNIEVPYAIPPFLEKLPPLLPYEFVKSTAFQMYDGGGTNAALLIMHQDSGALYPLDSNFEPVWYFYLLAFMVKTPIPLLIMLVLVWLFYNRLKRPEDKALLIPIIGFYLLFTILIRRQLGYRLVLQCLPFIFIFVSKLTDLLGEGNSTGSPEKGRKQAWKDEFLQTYGKFVLAALCIWFIISSLLIFPYYPSYFSINQQGAYRVWRESSIDWGQDLYRLYAFLDERNINKLGLAYFGFPTYWTDYSGQRLALPQREGLTTVDFCGETDMPVAVSVTELNNHRECYGWLLSKTPDARIGYSIYLYNLDNNTKGDN